MRVLLIDSYLGTSHNQWAEGLKKFSQHQIKIIGLKPIYWKMKMQAGAVTLAEKINNDPFHPDVILATSMVNLPLLKSLLKPELQNIPTVLYFHENQFFYPKSSNDTDIATNRDNHYGFLQFTSSLVAKQVWFNSQYNFNSFFKGLKDKIDVLPNMGLSRKIEEIIRKSKVIPLGLEFPNKMTRQTNSSAKTLLWNHRWEEDKNPNLFIELLNFLLSKKIAFKLNICGVKHPEKIPELKKFTDNIRFIGFTETEDQYWQILSQSDILPCTSNHDFFGLSVLQAIYAGCYPILPNKLVYPEYISAPELLYKTKQEFFDKVLNAMQTKILPSFKHFAEPFNWTNVIVDYDLGFLNLPNND